MTDTTPAWHTATTEKVVPRSMPTDVSANSCRAARGASAPLHAYHTAAVALGAERPAQADDAEDAPHNRVAAEEYRAQLAREEEAGLFEEEDGEEERVEVDAAAEADDSLAVRPPPGRDSVSCTFSGCTPADG